MKVCLDAGHYIFTPGKRTPIFEDSGLFIHEAEQNYPIMFKLVKYLNINGIETVITNNDINHNMSLRDRVNISNNNKVDIFISIHKNAITGQWQNTAKGIETYCYKFGGNGEKLAKQIHEQLMLECDMKDRGVKEGNFCVIRETKAPAVLLELGFMDYRPEADQMKNELWHNKYAKAIAKGVCKYFKVDFKENNNLTPIVSGPTATMEQMMRWAKIKDTSQEFINLASMYYTMAQKIGINPVFAYAQFAHETGFLYKIPSSAGLNASYHNPCGLKITKGGGDYQPSAHKRFSCWEDGISAHLDHIALYAGMKGYPKQDTLDPRHFNWIFGTAKYIEQLSGKWAPSKKYADKILKFMKEMEGTEVKNSELENKDLKIKQLEQQVRKLTEETKSLKNRISIMKAGAMELAQM
jgi:N-acetylmuramoyl-L-alanine amidase